MVHTTLFTTLFSILSILVSPSLAVPLFGITFGSSSDNSAPTTDVSNATVTADFLRPMLFSGIAYCSNDVIQSFTCGGLCDAVGSDVDVLQVGGNDGTIPTYFVAHDPSTNSIVVAHQGTDPSNIMSILNDVKLALVDLDTTKFAAATGKGIKVHDGFQETFERTADEILAAVQQGLEENNAKNVLITGHSLGAAVASLDAMFLKGKLDPSIQITTTVFGLPRVGDQAWADFVDSNLGNSFSFITNQHDPVPRLPPLDFDYVHPSGEFHITSVDSNGQATGFVACPGQDNEKCSSGLNIFEVSIPNHLGPYFDNISLGSCSA